LGELLTAFYGHLTFICKEIKEKRKKQHFFIFAPAGDRTHDQQKNGKNGCFAIRLPSSPARGPVPDCGA